MLELAILTIFPLAMLLSASMDMLTMTIPNKISLALVAGFFVLAPFVGLGWQELGMHIGVAFALLIVGMGMFAMGWIGGGDAKLFAATGLWLGFTHHLFDYALIASIIGGVLTLLILKLRSLPSVPGFMSFSWMLRLHDPKEGCRMGWHWRRLVSLFIPIRSGSMPCCKRGNKGNTLVIRFLFMKNPLVTRSKTQSLNPKKPANMRVFLCLFQNSTK